MADDPEKTNPGMTQDEDGTISIGPGDLQRALREQKEAMQVEQDALNDELASGREPGSEAGSDQPDSKKNSGA